MLPVLLTYQPIFRYGSPSLSAQRDFRSPYVNGREFILAIVLQI